MTTRKESFVMNYRRLIVATASGIAITAFASACWMSDPCGKGLVEDPHSGNCMMAPAPTPEAGPDTGAAASDGGGEAAAAPDTSAIGKACTITGTDPVCTGAATQCGAPQLPYCTATNCQAGEANAGICPSGFTCQTFPGYPSFCMKN